MPFIDPDKIIIPPDRYRKDFSSVEKRAEDIAKVGQFVPILVKEQDGQLILIDGECRTRACKLLRRKVWYTTDTEGQIDVSSEYQHRLLELMSNTARQDMNTIEKSVAISDLDRLLKTIHGQAGQSHTREPGQEGWSAEKTANLMGYKNKGTVQTAITIAAAAQTMPELAEAKTTSEAMKMIQTKIRLEAQTELARRSGEIKQSGPIDDPIEYFSKRVILGDCLEGMKKLSSGIISIFLTDIPYGIDYKTEVLFNNKSIKKDLTKKVAGLYHDLPEDILPLIESVIQQMTRTGRPNCYVYMFCAYRYWTHLSIIFEQYGFNVYNKPITWVRGNLSNGTLESGNCNCPGNWPASNTDCILFAYRGNTILAKQGQNDVIICNSLLPNNKIHSLQRPIQLLVELISRVFHPETKGILVDPFAGSGSSLAAALHFPGLEFFGFEKDPDFRDRAVSYLVNYYTEMYNPKLDPIIDLELE